MDTTLLYLGYCHLGRETFLEKASAALVILGEVPTEEPAKPQQTADPDFDAEVTQTAVGAQVGDQTLRVYRLQKKEGAPFSDMITIGRTPNNDVCIADSSISRFHAFFRDDKDHWIVCDAGSKNGTKVNGKALGFRVESEIASGAVVKMGDVVMKFYTPDDLFDALEPFSH